MTEDRLQPPDAGPAFSHPLRVESIKLRGNRVRIAADESQRDRIASELGLDSLDQLETDYVLSRSGDNVALEGSITAKLHQICVVTLDPFPVDLTVPLTLAFAPEEPSRVATRRAESEAVDVEVALDADDPPEPIVDGVIDLGAVTLEFLALALDPYPRKPGVSFAAGPVEPARESPFAALAKLKRDG